MDGAPGDPLEVDLGDQLEATVSTRQPRARGGRRSGSRSGGNSAPASDAHTRDARTRDDRAGDDQGSAPRVEDVATVAAEAAVEILDLPIATQPRAPRKISTQDAELILDSVLDALPEPKQPGQGRSRTSRRASSGGTVSPTPEV